MNKVLGYALLAIGFVLCLPTMIVLIPAAFLMSLGDELLDRSRA